MRALFLLTCAVLLPFTSLAQKAAELAQDQASTLADLDDLMAKAEERLQKTLQNLERMTQEIDDPGDAYDDFRSNFEAMKAVREDMKEKIGDLREISTNRYTAWEQEADAMNGELRALSEDQLAKARKRFGEIDQNVKETGLKVSDLVANLEMLSRYFQTGLNPNAVMTAAPVIDKARLSGRETLQAVGKVRENYRQLRAEVGGGKPD